MLTYEVMKPLQWAAVSVYTEPGLLQLSPVVLSVKMYTKKSGGNVKIPSPNKLCATLFTSNFNYGIKEYLLHRTVFKDGATHIIP